MQVHEHEIEFDEFLGIFYATLHLEFTYAPHERETNCREEVMLTKVTVTSLEAEEFMKTQAEIEDGGWDGPLGDLALDACLQEIDVGGWLEDELLCVARMGSLGK